MKWSAGVRRGTSWETGKLRLSLNIWGKFKNPMVHYLELTSIHHPSQSHDLLLLGIVTIAMGLHGSTTLFPTDFNPSRQPMGRDMRPWNTCCEEQDSHHGNISRDTYIYIYVYIYICICIHIYIWSMRLNIVCVLFSYNHTHGGSIILIKMNLIEDKIVYSCIITIGYYLIHSLLLGFLPLWVYICL